MSIPIEVAYNSGATLYAIIHHPDGRTWNNLSQIFEAYNSAHWAQYAVPVTEQGASGYYRGVYPAAISGVLTTELIYVQGGGSPAISDVPSIGVGQSQGQNIGALAGDAVAAANQAKACGSMITAAAISGTLTNVQMTTNLPDTTDDVYIGRIIVWTSGALLRQVANVTAYQGSARKLTYSPVNGVPGIGDTFVIV